MTAATLTRPNAHVRLSCKSEKSVRTALPAKPDRQLWKTDRAKAFEAGVRWFLAVSRAA
jgi:hypothetical protein